MQPISAKCKAGIVTVEGLPVEATILSKGIGDSEGLLILSGVDAYYIANTTKDIEDINDSLTGILNDFIPVLTVIDSTATGGSNAASISAITAKILQFTALKELLL